MTAAPALRQAHWLAHLERMPFAPALRMDGECRDCYAFLKPQDPGKPGRAGIACSKVDNAKMKLRYLALLPHA